MTPDEAHAREVLVDRVAKLEAFGSADQIRDYFVQEQVVGQPCKRNACVVARYLAREIEAELGGRWVTSVDGALISLSQSQDDLYAVGGATSTPPAILELIKNFDGRRYPELESHDD